MNISRFVSISLIISISILTDSFAQSQFTDESLAAGLLSGNGHEGVAVGDYNNDGYDDLYISSISGQNQCYRNNKDGTFTEVGGTLGLSLAQSTISQAAIWGDINNDGWVDLYVGNKSEQDRLFLNNAGNSFDEISFDAGIYQVGHPKSVNMADINNDGYLDIYVSNFGSENAMYINNQNNTFTNYIYASGALDSGEAMGTIFFDYDKDGDQDLYLVHDHLEPNLLYQNDGEGNFTDVSLESGTNTMSYGMGVDVGDVNNDGWQDIYIANFGQNYLLLNKGDGTFDDISVSAGVHDGGMGWGAFFFDYNRDGLIDIYTVNSVFPNQTNFPNVLYRNVGSNKFERDGQDTVISAKNLSFGTAYLDFDLDGNLDVMVANRGEDESIQLLKNGEHIGNWLGLKLVGIESNVDAIGAKIKIVDQFNRLHYRELITGQSWSSQNSKVQYFGLGSAVSLSSIELIWPSGNITNVPIPDLNAYYTIYENGEIVTGLDNNLTSIMDNLKLNENFIDIFPNPSNGRFNVRINEDINEPVSVNIYDLVGRKVYYRQFEPSNRKINIDLNIKELTSSNFLTVVITTKSSTYSKSLIID